MDSRRDLFMPKEIVDRIGEFCYRNDDDIKYLLSYVKNGDVIRDFLAKRGSIELIDWWHKGNKIDYECRTTFQIYLIHNERRDVLEFIINKHGLDTVSEMLNCHCLNWTLDMAKWYMSINPDIKDFYKQDAVIELLEQISDYVCTDKQEIDKLVEYLLTIVDYDSVLKRALRFKHNKAVKKLKAMKT